MLGALAREAIGRDAARFARNNGDGAITTKTRVERTLDKTPSARAWLTETVEEAVEAMGGHRTIERARAIVAEIEVAPVAAITMGRSATLAHLSRAAQRQLARTAGWAARCACARLDAQTLEQSDPHAWTQRLIEEAAGAKIAGAQGAQCNDETACEALEWPLPECAPPLAALWADAAAQGADAQRWGARIEVEAGIERGACTGGEWERRVEESAAGYRARLRREIARRANVRMTRLAGEHRGARGRGGAGAGTAHDNGRWARCAGRAGAQALREAWRRERSLGGTGTPELALRCEPDPGRAPPRAGWWLDYRNANAFMAASEGRLAPWDIARYEGAWLGAHDPQWQEALKRHARSDAGSGPAAAQALARAMRALRQRWDESLD